MEKLLVCHRHTKSRVSQHGHGGGRLCVTHTSRHEHDNKNTMRSKIAIAINKGGSAKVLYEEGLSSSQDNERNPSKKTSLPRSLRYDSSIPGEHNDRSFRLSPLRKAENEFVLHCLFGRFRNIYLTTTDVRGRTCSTIGG